MTRLFIVRHGNTFAAGEPPRRIGAGSDLPLVASGHAQAAALGDLFRRHGIVFERALAGPLRRTRETAAAILADAALAVTNAPWLTEIDHGPDEGRPEAAVIARLGADALAAWDRDGIAPAGWRTDAEHRIAAWRALLGDPPAGDTLIVTSNGAARFVFGALPAQQPHRGLKLRTGAYGVLAVERGEWRLKGWDLRPDDGPPPVVPPGGPAEAGASTGG